MYIQEKKAKENKSITGINSVTKKKRVLEHHTGFVDKRPEAIIQQKLQEKIHNSGQGSNPHRVLQLSKEIARRNWRVIYQYSQDQAKRVIREFLRAGYTANETGRMIVPLIDQLGHGNQVFAHGSGGSDSGTQGDTMIRIRSCVNDLIEWARANPKPKEKKSSGKRDFQGGNGSGKGGNGGKGNSGGGSKRIGTGHLASWITGRPAWYANRTDKY